MAGFDRLLDTRPLRDSPTFRRFYIGSTLQMFGRQISMVAIMYQIWDLTHSSFWVGFSGLVGAIPMVVFGFVGGVLADTRDRRMVILITTAGAMIAAALLALQALLDLRSLVVIFAVIAVQQAFASAGSPARQATLPRILPPQRVPAAIALMHLSFQASLLAGPAISGFVIAQWGVGGSYVLFAVLFLGGFYGVVSLPPLPPQSEVHHSGIRSAIDGLAYMIRRPLLRGSLATDVAATLLVMPFSVLPALNEARFNGSPETLGLFFSAVAVGGIGAATLSGPFTRARHSGRVQLAAAATWCLALAGVGLAPTLWFALGLLAVAGAADTTAVISRNALIQVATPDAYRGRITSAEQVVGIAGPQFGNFRGGVVASMSSPGFSLVSGGFLAAAIIGWISWRNRELRDYQRPRD